MSNYSVRDRYKLFNACVAESVLYSCRSWTITEERAKKLRTAQRKMLRMMLGLGVDIQLSRELFSSPHLAPTPASLRKIAETLTMRSRSLSYG